MPGWKPQLYRFHDLFINSIFIKYCIWTLQIILIEVSADRQNSQGKLSLGHVPIEKYCGLRRRTLYLVWPGSPIFGTKRSLLPPPPTNELNRIYLWGGREHLKNRMLEKQSNTIKEEPEGSDVLGKVGGKGGRDSMPSPGTLPAPPTPPSPLVHQLSVRVFKEASLCMCD